ncbi:MAG: hypothetical protein HW403_693 [Dehalococcoidia bacterium]|nr:hypothetical protein [Dehalococcoidia bacterium]
MRALASFFDKFEVAGELLSFLWRRKLWWLMPLVAFLLLFGLILVFGQATGIAPFIYTFF